jgi:teichuronic acid biosynthesis glycosyltransferase TuaC
MKVLLLTSMFPTPDRPFRGTFVWTQAETLRRAGVEVDVQMIAGESDGPRIVRGARKYAAAVPELRRRVATGEVDLVHAHYSFAGVIALLQRRVPVVVTYHGDDLLGTAGPDGRLRLVSRLVVVPSSRALGRLVSGRIVQSPQMASSLRGQERRVIPCELDTDIFHPVDRDDARRRLGLNSDKCYLLFAADPGNPGKNFPFAERVAAEVRRQVPDAELLTVFRERQQTLALYMNACDVLLFPSYQEGSPNLVRQALACGLPVVASDAGDVQDTLADGRVCFALPLELAPFVAAVTDVIGSGRRADPESLGLERFGRAATARQLIDVYEKALRSWGRMPGERRGRRAALTGFRSPIQRSRP